MALIGNTRAACSLVPWSLTFCSYCLFQEENIDESENEKGPIVFVLAVYVSSTSVCVYVTQLAKLTVPFYSIAGNGTYLSQWYLFP